MSTDNTYSDALERLYSQWLWPEDPSTREAQERFNTLLEYAHSLVSTRLAYLAEKDRVAVLDVAAGSGIAGAAFAAALARRGARVSLVVTDLRVSILEKVHVWLEKAGLKEGVRVETVAVDAARLPQKLDCCFDLALLWGSSLPHFSPWRLLLALAGVRELQPRHGILLIEQRDLLPRLLFNNLYTRIRVEYVKEDGRGVVGVHAKYDQFRGIVARVFYELPGYRYLTTMPTRLWDLASVAAMLWIFYNHVYLEKPSRDPWGAEVLVAMEPRETAPSSGELWETLPEQLHEEP
ncbi:hypothetical protein Pyrde_0809 [Pyrodictium delaneyi]|uniref:Methyltransferase domain-containing protein n=1 Tax=Pyrodictium delaneyi TaxID=1273541 RepID=A0A0P0N3N0_9CREN|nr:methyltransferase domain-containing protein [Pyrodictium delaneyi]ALL00859.1 hypothetical protein Pyrde_0809 [Pyrodictium delaneyi]OWJ55515.1 hypothetical protein Pdsh_01600 [Pyrodictium delaneyi]